MILSGMDSLLLLMLEIKAYSSIYLLVLCSLLDLNAKTALDMRFFIIIPVWLSVLLELMLPLITHALTADLADNGMEQHV